MHGVGQRNGVSPAIEVDVMAAWAMEGDDLTGCIKGWAITLVVPKFSQLT